MAQSQSSIKLGTAIITGHVTLDGKPAPGVPIVLASCEEGGYPKNYPPPVNSVTDGDGQFHLEAIPAGRYCIESYAPAYVSASRTEYLKKVLTVADGETVDGIDLTLQKGGVITGRVTNADDRPVIEETVFLYGYNTNSVDTNPQWIGWGRTDDRGIYRVYGLRPGRYAVRAGSVQPGEASKLNRQANYVATYYPNVVDIHQAKRVELAADQEISDIDIVLGRPLKSYSVSGSVIDAETGANLPNMQVVYLLYDRDGKQVTQHGPVNTPTDQKGEFIIDGLGSGYYGVQVSGEKGSTYYSEIARFEIADGNVRGLLLKASRASTISGTAVFDGVNDPAVLSQLSKLVVVAQSYPLEGYNPGSSAKTNVAADGSFKLTGLRPGRVSFGLYNSANPVGSGITLLRVEGQPVARRHEIIVQPGESPSDIRLIIGFGNGIVHVTIKANGIDLPDNTRLQATATTMVGSVQNSTSYILDARNQVTMSNLLPGRYEFGASFQTNGTRTIEIESQKQIVEVTNGSEQTITIIATIKPLRPDKP